MSEWIPTDGGANGCLLAWVRQSSFAKSVPGLLNDVTLLEQALNGSNGVKIQKSIELLKKLWDAHPELGPNPQKLLDKLAEFQADRTYYSNYRDHVGHSLKVFLLGLYLYDRCSPIRQAMASKTGSDKDFQRCWLAASGFHDVGYLIEHKPNLTDTKEWETVQNTLNDFYKFPISYTTALGLKKATEQTWCQRHRLHSPEIAAIEQIGFDGDIDLLLSIAEVTKSAKLGKNFREYYNFARQTGPKGSLRNSFHDHGILSAMVLLQGYQLLANRIEDLTNPRNNITHAKVQKIQELKTNLIPQKIETAASALALHNVDMTIWNEYDLTANGFWPEVYCVNLTDNPLGFLLILADTLQDWDRPLFRNLRPGEHVLTSDQVSLKIKENKLLIRYKLDEDRFRHPENDADSHFSKVKKELRSKLDGDDLERVFGYDTGNPKSGPEPGLKPGPIPEPNKPENSEPNKPETSEINKSENSEPNKPETSVTKQSESTDMMDDPGYQQAYRYLMDNHRHLASILGDQSASQTIDPSTLQNNQTIKKWIDHYRKKLIRKFAPTKRHLNSLNERLNRDPHVMSPWYIPLTCWDLLVHKRDDADNKNYSFQDIFREKNQCVVIGEPGCGKTVSIDSFCLAQAERVKNTKDTDTDTVERIPIVLAIKEMSDLSLHKALQARLVKSCGNMIDDDLFRAGLSLGVFLFLLDGVNEFIHLDGDPDKVPYRQLLNDLSGMTRDYPLNHFLVTSRSLNFPDHHFIANGFSIFALSKLRDDQIRDYGSKVLNQNHVKDFNLWLNDRDNMELCRVPLYLNMLCIATRGHSHFTPPANAGDLHERTLAHLRKNVVFSGDLKLIHFERILGQYAFATIINKGNQFLVEARLRTELQNYFSDKSKPYVNNLLEIFINHLGEAGLLRTNANGQPQQPREFVHQSFIEYYASRVLRDDVQTGSLSVLEQLLPNLETHDTISLFFSYYDSPSRSNLLLAVGKTNPMLMVRCLEKIHDRTPTQVPRETGFVRNAVKLLSVHTDEARRAFLRFAHIHREVESDLVKFLSKLQPSDWVWRDMAEESLRLRYVVPDPLLDPIIEASLEPHAFHDSPLQYLRFCLASDRCKVNIKQKILTQFRSWYEDYLNVRELDHAKAEKVGRFIASLLQDHPDIFDITKETIESWLHRGTLVQFTLATIYLCEKASKDEAFFKLVIPVLVNNTFIYLYRFGYYHGYQSTQLRNNLVGVLANNWQWVDAIQFKDLCYQAARTDFVLMDQIGNHPSLLDLLVQYYLSGNKDLESLVTITMGEDRNKAFVAAFCLSKIASKEKDARLLPLLENAITQISHASSIEVAINILVALNDGTETTQEQIPQTLNYFNVTIERLKKHAIKYTDTTFIDHGIDTEEWQLIRNLRACSKLPLLKRIVLDGLARRISSIEGSHVYEQINRYRTAIKKLLTDDDLYIQELMLTHLSVYSWSQGIIGSYKTASGKTDDSQALEEQCLEFVIKLSREYNKKGKVAYRHFPTDISHIFAAFRVLEPGNNPEMEDFTARHVHHLEPFRAAETLWFVNFSRPIYEFMEQSSGHHTNLDEMIYNIFSLDMDPETGAKILLSYLETASVDFLPIAQRLTVIGSKKVQKLAQQTTRSLFDKYLLKALKVDKEHGVSELIVKHLENQGRDKEAEEMAHFFEICREHARGGNLKPFAG
ncbi:MAG: NACHT domain-containing protein [Magnetococcales bacterium]|nr:NACHT domain-containing protein [Magnetococcales bacterium]